MTNIDKGCPGGTFGTNCLERCSCRAGRVASPPCDTVNGRCNCLPGYSGTSCDDGETIIVANRLARNRLLHFLVCPSGTFGADCMESCLCMEGRVESPECNSVNGSCNCLPEYSGIYCELEGCYS